MSQSDSEEVHQVTERQLVVYRPPVTDIVPRYWKFGDRAYCHPELGDFWELRRLIHWGPNHPFPSPQQVSEEYQILDNIISIRRTLHWLRKTKRYQGDWSWLVQRLSDLACPFGEHNWWPAAIPIRPPTFAELNTPKIWKTQHFYHYFFPATEFTATPTEQYYQIRDRDYDWWFLQQLEEFDIDNDWDQPYTR